EVRSCGIGMLRAVEVLGPEQGLLRSIPLCGFQMQLALAAVEQRRIDTLLNQRVSEQVIARLGPRQVRRRERVTLVLLIVDEKAQRFEREALADDRRSLQSQFVGRRQSIHACEHEALDRGRNTPVQTLAGIAQQLLQE